MPNQINSFEAFKITLTKRIAEKEFTFKNLKMTTANHLLFAATLFRD